ncbi:MAG: hypothetical protein AAGC56_06180 [Pseudomonadota bacterium]
MRTVPLDASDGWRPASVWGLALLYGASYACFSLVANRTGAAPTSGTDLSLKAAAFALIVCIPVYVFRRRLAARAAALAPQEAGPGAPAAAASGLATAVIALTTLAAFSFSGVSILFALLMMRGGVLILSPIIDAASRRRIRRQSVLLLSVSVLVVAYALSRTGEEPRSGWIYVNLGAYLLAYAVRLSVMSREAKRDRPGARAAFAAAEFRWASVFLLTAGLSLAALAAATTTTTTTTTMTAAGGWSIAAHGASGGVAYAAVLFAGTLIYLDPREHSFTIPVNRGAGLAGGAAGAVVGGAFGLVASPSWAELTSAAVILLALACAARFERRQHPSISR